MSKIENDDQGNQEKVKKFFGKYFGRLKFLTQKNKFNMHILHLRIILEYY